MPYATITGDASGSPRAKDLKYLQLWDCYGALLTDNQREICEMYYALDLSLSEIAEQKGVSRQSVSEVLKKSREMLDYYEEKLRHCEETRAYSLAVSSMMTGLTAALEAFKGKHPEFTSEVDELIGMVAVGEEISFGGEN